MTTALKARGCAASNLKVFLGDGQSQQEAIFSTPDLKSRSNPVSLAVQSKFPGITLFPATKIAIEGAITDLNRIVKPGDVIYLLVTGHSYNKIEFPIYDGKISTNELSLWLGQLPSTVLIRIFYDVCFSGALVDILADKNMCVLSSTDKINYSKYSFNNSYSIQLAAALKNPKISILQAHLQADRRDIKGNNSYSSLEQVIDDATGLMKTEDIAQILLKEKFSSSTILGNILSPLLNFPSQLALDRATQPQRSTNPLISIRVMLDFPVPPLYEQFKKLKAKAQRTGTENIQYHDIEMSLRLKYVMFKGSVYNKKRLQNIALCMGESL